MKNLKTCTAILFYVGFFMAKVQGHNKNNSLDIMSKQGSKSCMVNSDLCYYCGVRLQGK